MAEDDASVLPQSRSRSAARERSVKALAFISSQLSLVQESAPVLLQVISAAHEGTQQVGSTRDGAEMIYTFWSSFQDWVATELA